MKIYVTMGFSRMKLSKLLLIMKLTVVLTVLCSIQLTASVYSQKTKLSLNMKKKSLVEIMKEIRSKSEFTFVYDVEDVKGIIVKRARFKSATVEEILNECLSKTKLTYEVIDKVVILKQTLLRSVSNKQIKLVTISGKVTDEHNNPLPGVSVFFKETPGIGSISDLNGYYEMAKTLDEQQTLVFSSIGYDRQEVSIGDKTNIDVVLVESTMVEEVVITGYQTIDAGRATGSFKLLGEKDINTVYSLSVEDRLEGLVPGLKVDKDNKIIIRGQGTFAAETTPLIVIDGFPIQGSTIDIDPNDIAQITVLKDAASCAIWGVRSANGVIVITTKEAKMNKKLSVSVNANFSSAQRYSLSDLHRASSAEQVDYEWELLNNYAGTDVMLFNMFFWGKSHVGEVFINNSEFDWNTFEAVLLDEENALAQLNDLKAYDNSKDLEEYFFRNELTQHYNISLTSGGENSSTYTSLSFNSVDGALIGDESKEFRFVVNNNVRFTDKINLKLGIKGNYSNDDQNGIDPSNMTPYNRLFNDDGTYAAEYSIDWDQQFLNSFEEDYGYLNWEKNRLQERHLNNRNIKRYGASVQLGLDFQITSWLKYKTGGNYEVSVSNNDILHSPQSFFVRNLVNYFTIIDGDGELDHQFPKGAILQVNDVRTNSYSFRNSISFDENFNNINVKAMFGNEIFEKYWISHANEYAGYDDQSLFHQNVDWKALQNGSLTNFNYENGFHSGAIGTNDDLNRHVSWYGTASVSYKGKYDLFSSIRTDETNLFGKSAKYRRNLIWSVGSKWDISQEDFFNVDWVNNLSLKASYGTTGVADKSTSPYLITRVTYEQDFFQQTLAPYLPENRTLRWETSNVLNAAINFSLFNNRFGGSVEYYNKLSSDVLANERISDVSGWDIVKKNSAEILNTGVEIDLFFNAIQTTDFSWDINVNLSYNKNEIEKLLGGEKTAVDKLFSYAYAVGDQIGAIYAYRSGGLDAEGEPTLLTNNGEVYRWDAAVDLDQETIIYRAGQSIAPVFGGFGSQFKWKGLGLNAFVTYSFGNDIILPSYESQPHFLVASINDNIVKRWRQPGDEANTWVPKADEFDDYRRNNAVTYSDVLLDDGDVIKLKSISLDINLNWLTGLKMFDHFNLRLSGENLWFWAANKENLDPEYVNRGYSFPASKTFVASLNIKF